MNPNLTKKTISFKLRENKYLFGILIWRKRHYLEQEKVREIGYMQRITHYLDFHKVINLFGHAFDESNTSFSIWR